MHRLPGDEIFHFYLGDPVEMLQLRPDGTGEVLILGPDILHGMRPQTVVAGGVWQGSQLAAGGSQDGRRTHDALVVPDVASLLRGSCAARSGAARAAGYAVALVDTANDSPVARTPPRAGAGPSTACCSSRSPPGRRAGRAAIVSSSPAVAASGVPARRRGRRRRRRSATCSSRPHPRSGTSPRPIDARHVPPPARARGARRARRPSAAVRLRARTGARRGARAARAHPELTALTCDDDVLARASTSPPPSSAADPRGPLRGRVRRGLDLSRVVHRGFHDGERQRRGVGAGRPWSCSAP